MSADRIELGLGIEDSRPPQVRFALERSATSGVRLVAAHTGQPTKLQSLARFEVDEAGGHVTCELLPLGSVDMARAFGVVPGFVIPIRNDVQRAPIPSGEPRPVTPFTRRWVDSVEINPSARMGRKAKPAEDDGFETIDLTGITGRPSVQQIEGAAFDTEQAILINGVLYAPLDRVIRTIGVERDSAVFFDNGPLTIGPHGLDARGIWMHGRDHMRDVAIRALRAHFAFCAKCGGKPVITNIDLDDLCGPCATKWVLAEGQAEHDRQEAEAEHREEGDAHAN